MKTAVLLIGFGGPTRPEEVKPFLLSIVDGTQIPEARIQEVLRHYEVIGGRSPFNEITEGQKRALQELLKKKGYSFPIGVAYRHSTPTFADAFETFKRHHVERVIGLVLASFRSFVSREWYHQRAEEGRKAAASDPVEIRYTRSFDQDPLYLTAQAERVREIWNGFDDGQRARTAVIFTAHSIPTSMCQQSCGENENRCYGSQFYDASSWIARRLGIGRWFTSYQSQSGSPRDLWLGPDIKEKIRSLDRSRYSRVLLVPVGFLCDNVEVIYDLDHEAKETAQGLGLEYFRAGTVGDHPLFIEMMADRILEEVRNG